MWGNESSYSKALKITLSNVFGNLFDLLGLLFYEHVGFGARLRFFLFLVFFVSSITCLIIMIKDLVAFAMSETGNFCLMVILYKSLWKLILIVKWFRSFFINSFMLRHGIGFGPFLKFLNQFLDKLAVLVSTLALSKGHCMRVRTLSLTLLPRT